MLIKTYGNFGFLYFFSFFALLYVIWVESTIVFPIFLILPKITLFFSFFKFFSVKFDTARRMSENLSLICLEISSGNGSKREPERNPASR